MWIALANWAHHTLGPLAAARQLEAGLRHVREETPLLRGIASALTVAPFHPLRITALNRLARLHPTDVGALTELARALLGTAAAGSALKPLRAAVALGADSSELLLALASLESQQGNIAVSDELLARVTAREPMRAVAWCSRFHNACVELRWAEARELAERTRAAVAAQGHVHDLPNHALLMLYGDAPPALLPGYRRAGPAPRPTWPQSRRLRLGYLSSDLQTHATAILMAGLLEAHDRSRVEVFAYSYGPRNADAYRARMNDAVEHWADLNDVDDTGAAQRIAADRLDILVELKGHTFASRLGITALRPAPVQLHYLGYPGPIGGYGIDYFVADAVTVPPGAEAEFPEHVLRLPRCYQVNDSRRPLPAVPPADARHAHGLPADALVLANFNQSWKLGEWFVDCWLDALVTAPDAVLWLLDPGPTGQERLLQRARERGVVRPEGRVLFTGRIDPVAHIDRLQLADLAVDQLPCSSHTTAADALWAGVPLLTVEGQRFAGRVAASIVRAVGEDDFVARDPAHYRERLFALLADPAPLAAARQRLIAARSHAALWDTAGFTRDFEAMLFSLVKAV